MNHNSENSTGVFAIGTLLATDDLVADEVQALGLEVKGRQLGWVTAPVHFMMHIECFDDASRRPCCLVVGTRRAITVDQFRELLRTIDWNAHLHAGRYSGRYHRQSQLVKK